MSTWWDRPGSFGVKQVWSIGTLVLLVLSPPAPAVRAEMNLLGV